MEMDRIWTWARRFSSACLEQSRFHFPSAELQINDVCLRQRDVRWSLGRFRGTLESNRGATSRHWT